MTPDLGATCAQHPGHAAVAICSRCGSFACRQCARVENDAWLCSKCGTTRLPRANLGNRFVANLVDNAVVVGPLFVGAATLVAAAIPWKGDSENPTALILGGTIMVLGMLGAMAGQIVAQLVWGQSIGKRWMKIKVVQVNGQPAEWWRVVLVRNLAFHAVAQLCGLVALVDPFLIFGAEQRCLHDYLAGTIVVDVTSEPP